MTSPPPNLSAGARIACAAAAAVCGLLLLSMSPQRGGWIMTLVTWGVAVLATARPFDGLLVLAGLGPVVTILSILLGANTSGVHFTEALTLAFLTGATARRAAVSAPFAVPARIALPAVVLIAAAAASAIVQSAVLGAELREPVTAGAFLRQLVGEYLMVQNTATVAVQFASGLLLLLVVTDICTRATQRWDRVLVMMVAAATGAAVLNIVRLVTAAMRQEDVWTTLIGYLGSARVNVQYPDWNAAGSYFAMLFLIAAGFVAARRFAMIAPLFLVAIALWLTGSRTAMAAVPVALAAVALLSMRKGQIRRTIMIAAVLALVVAGVAVGWIWYPSQRNDPVSFSVSTRFELWKAGVRMMMTDPVFGVGLGRFFVLSPDYAASTLQIIWRARENAHNYFIQILAELGIPGLVLFLAVVSFPLRDALRMAGGNKVSWAVAAGLTVFLLTCLTGHPFVVPDAAYPFWIVLAIAASMTGGTDRRYGRWTVWLAAGIILLLVVTLPARVVSAVRQANRENASVGLSAWDRDEAGTRFRWAGTRSTFFVESSGRSIRIPIRRGPDAPGDLRVRIFFNGKEAERIDLQPDQAWRYVRLVLPQRGSDGAFFRIDLEAGVGGDLRSPESTGSRILMVGQPAVLWDK